MRGGKIWIVIVIIAALITAAVIFALTRGGMNSINQSAQTTGGGTSTSTPESTSNTATAGKYMDYSSETVANTQGRKWLFFHAGWCPQCRALEKDIQSKGVPNGITIFKVDYDRETALKKKYGVTLQTTIVEIDDQGNEVKKFVAYDEPTISAVVKALGG